MPITNYNSYTREALFWHEFNQLPEAPGLPGAEGSGRPSVGRTDVYRAGLGASGASAP
jgi:hypothetical protein